MYDNRVDRDLVVNPVDNRKATASQWLLSCQIAPSKFTIPFSQPFHSRRVKRNFISHRCIYTRVKVYRSVMPGVDGYRKRYFAYMTQRWKGRFQNFQLIWLTARLKWERTSWTMKFLCRCDTKAHLSCACKQCGMGKKLFLSLAAARSWNYSASRNMWKSFARNAVEAAPPY